MRPRVSVPSSMKAVKAHLVCLNLCRLPTADLQERGSSVFSLQNISKCFGEFPAVTDVSLEMKNGESLVLAGESGSGKTTLCRIAAGMERADTGQVALDGKILAPSCRKRSFSDCAAIQYIFQDPYHALEPGFTVQKTLRECARICERHQREVMPPKDALAYVDRRLLEYLDRPVRELSGGQRQKVCIARALMPYPRVIIADESTSMLDKQSGTEVFDLLHRIKEEKNIILLAILHDVDFSCTRWERIAVMYQGRLVEQAPFAKFRSHAKHEYSRALIAAYDYFNGKRS